MRTKTFSDKEAWFAGRIGKISGSRIKELSTQKKDGSKPIGYYRFLADLLAKPDYSEENPMARGTRLEPEAVARFEKETGKNVDTSLVIWEHEDDPRIAVSPDGFISSTEAVEVKCLASEKHLEAQDNQKITTEYKMQATQYFVVNSKLKTLYFCFYDPRLIALDFFYIKVDRKEIAKDIDDQLALQKSLLADADAFINKHTF